MNYGDVEQMHHIARLAFLAMAARAVAASEFEGNPEVYAVTITVSRADSEPYPALDLAFVGQGGLPLGGMSL